MMISFIFMFCGRVGQSMAGAGQAERVGGLFGAAWERACGDQADVGDTARAAVIEAGKRCSRAGTVGHASSSDLLHQIEAAHTRQGFLNQAGGSSDGLERK